MGFKIKIDKDIRRALGIKVQNNKIVKDFSVLVPEVRKQFRIKGAKEARKAVLRDVTKGLSPVNGKLKFEKYSDSYREEIRKGVSNRMRAASPKKRRSPVSLRLTGELHRTLKVFTSGGFTDKFRLVFDWRDFLADIHNRQGAGKKKVIRRLLPTGINETFNRGILKSILTQLNKAAAVIARRFS